MQPAIFTDQAVYERKAAQPVVRQVSIPLGIYAVIFSLFYVITGNGPTVGHYVVHEYQPRWLSAPLHVIIYTGPVVAALSSAYQILSLILTKNSWTSRNRSFLGCFSRAFRRYVLRVGSLAAVDIRSVRQLVA